MLVSNKISRTLEGPYRFIGFYFVIATVMALFNQAWVLFSIHFVLGWFLLGSYSGVDIDTEKQQFRSFNMWFGVVKTGKWKSVHNFVGLTLVSMNKVYSLYSQSNRSTTSRKKEFRIYFVNEKKRPAIAVKKCVTHDEGQKCMDELAIWLHLPVYSVMH
ncbi:hypothetical protein SLH46_05440 [Draconibacterium sp. IB214405]|uniref:hypothetical protein n=1 Tax=Draconibacterium sp. IB214405 TaxID=3097352 RepID=UPI002A0DB5F7|nr:hypothetical protein [Draconibacterium sp. IB214405]MDX8338614.1 hypothetical protein [Draconibacterium sp. IB214405]